MRMEQGLSLFAVSPPPATAPPGNAVRSYATITMALTQCTQAVTDAVRDAYTSFLKSQPGVVPDSVRVDVTCAEVVSGAGRGGGGPRRGGRGRAAPWGVGAGRAVGAGGRAEAGSDSGAPAEEGARGRRAAGTRGPKEERARPTRLRTHSECEPLDAKPPPSRRA
jgi:hypothetical protein